MCKIFKKTLKEIKNICSMGVWYIKYGKMKWDITKAIRIGRGLVIYTSEKNRCIGKTTLLSELSRSHELVIMVKYAHQKELLKRKGVNRVMHVPNIDSIRGMRSKKPILIDEGFSDEELLYLKSFYELYGFHRLNSKKA